MYTDELNYALYSFGLFHFPFSEKKIVKEKRKEIKFLYIGKGPEKQDEKDEAEEEIKNRNIKK